MLTLMTAALVAAQPAPPANTHAHSGQVQMPQGQMAPMHPPQHQAMMKDGCPCCRNMGKGGHHPQAPATPQPRR